MTMAVAGPVTSLCRAVMTGPYSAATEVLEHGTFDYIGSSLAAPDPDEFLQG
jgi:hypothetical protein